jgi:curved DNA-binding protein CbpA
MANQLPDLYAILGLTREATHEQIGHAYRTLLRRYHPDTRTLGDPADEAAADAALQDVLTAHAVLRDPGRRAAYDRRFARRPAAARGPQQRIYLYPTTPLQQPPWRVEPVRWKSWLTP